MVSVFSFALAMVSPSSGGATSAWGKVSGWLWYVTDWYPSSGCGRRRYIWGGIQYITAPTGMAARRCSRPILIFFSFFFFFLLFFFLVFSCPPTIRLSYSGCVREGGGTSQVRPLHAPPHMLLAQGPGEGEERERESVTFWPTDPPRGKAIHPPVPSSTQPTCTPPPSPPEKPGKTD